LQIPRASYHLKKKSKIYYLKPFSSLILYMKPLHAFTQKRKKLTLSWVKLYLPFPWTCNHHMPLPKKKSLLSVELNLIFLYLGHVTFTCLYTKNIIFSINHYLPLPWTCNLYMPLQSFSNFDLINWMISQLFAFHSSLSHHTLHRRKVMMISSLGKDQQVKLREWKYFCQKSIYYCNISDVTSHHCWWQLCTKLL
jgi:hypothetical protein